MRIDSLRPGDRFVVLPGDLDIRGTLLRLGSGGAYVELDARQVTQFTTDDGRDVEFARKRRVVISAATEVKRGGGDAKPG